jgi:uncharacterized phiE125 gp8 family phage protein
MSVPLSTIKSALKIDYDTDDIELVRWREAAQDLCARATGLSFVKSAQVLYLPYFKDSLLPAQPFGALTSVTYANSSNTITTMAATEYWLDRTQGPVPMIRFLTSPAMYPGTAITVNYSAGYDMVPAEIVHCVIALVGGWYNNPEAFQPIGLSAVPMSVTYILETMSVRSMLR